MEKVQVLFLWNVEEPLKRYLIFKLKNIQNLNLIFLNDLSDENIYSHAQTAQIMVGWRPTSELLARAKNLKLFINPGAGVQHLIPLFRNIDKSRQVKLINGHGNSYFTAQHAVALLLSLTNKITLHHNWMQQGIWRTGDLEGSSSPLWNKHVGLLGYGAINQKVHQLLAGFNCSFSILKRTWNDDQSGNKKVDDLDKNNPKIKKYTPDQLKIFLKNLDVLIIAIPLTEKTKGLLGEKEVDLLSEEAFIVNISRGPIIDEKALYSALFSKKIKGAAIDVWYNYNPDPIEGTEKRYPYSLPFHELDNIILSPHRAASPFDDLVRWDEQIENIGRFACGRNDFINVVDIDEEY